MSHVLPNSLGPVIVQATLVLATAIIEVAALSFLGLGEPDPAVAEWGRMLVKAQDRLQSRPAAGVPARHLHRHHRPGLHPARRVAARGAGPEVEEMIMSSTRRSTAAAAGGREPATSPARGRQPDASPSRRKGSATRARRGRRVVRGAPGRRWSGIVGERGSGKSVTSLAVMGLLPSRGVQVSGQVRYRGRTCSAPGPKTLNDLRGREIAMVFQDPMSSLNPVVPIGVQVTEVLLRHSDVSRARPRPRPRSCSAAAASRTRGAGSRSTRTSCPAGCGNGR